MRVLVTGAAGFIGSAVVRHLLERGGDEVIALDALTYAASPATLPACGLEGRGVFERADIRDAAALRAVFERHEPDAVLHLAAETHVDRSIVAPGDFVETNVVGSFVLLEAARRHWERLPAARRDGFRFLHVSTDEVFGSLEDGGRFSETSPYAPNSPYSASKASSDHLARAWHATYGLPTLLSNCSNNYGPFQFPEKLIPLMILNALEGQPLPVYGTGANVRDWLFVEDHAEALVRILRDGRPGDRYVIGGDAERSNIEVVRAICRILDRLAPAGAPHERLIAFIEDRPGHDLRYAVDASRIARELGWTPRMRFEEGLERTVAWYLDNRPWWEPLRRRGASRRILHEAVP